jgi:signal transduction histidine kinase
MQTLTQNAGLHPSLQHMLQRDLGALPTGSPQQAAEVISHASPAQIAQLVQRLDGGFRDFDFEMKMAAQALDQSLEEAVQLNHELQERADSLEAALADKQGALLELSNAKVQMMSQEKLASIGTLAAGVAHEINTPTQFVSDNLSFLKDAYLSINAVLTQLDLGGRSPAQAWADLQRTAKDCDLDFFRAEIPGALQQSVEGMERVAHIVKSMKEFSHPGSVGRQAVDLNRNILSTITVCRNEWKYVAEVATELDADLPPLPCFAGEVNQVVLNLVVNAVHAIQDNPATKSQPGGKGLIRVASRLDGEGIRIDIADSGCGIPPEIQARIFDPFFTTKEVGRGTGQGLALAHSVIVDRHQGRLSFDSKVGEGTTFHLWLPLAGSFT